MERFGVATAERECPDILGIKRLPPDRELRPLRIIPAMRRSLAWENSRRQDGGSVVAIPFFPFGKVYFQAVESREVPCGTCDWNTYFFVDAPDIAIHLEALPIH